MSPRVYWSFFRRWVYLLCVGMWRGERACTLYSRKGIVLAVETTKTGKYGLGSTITKTFYLHTP